MAEIPGQSYAALKGTAIVRAAQAAKGLAIVRSEDDGRTWSEAVVIAQPQRISEDRIRNVSFETFPRNFRDIHTISGMLLDDLVSRGQRI